MNGSLSVRLAVAFFVVVGFAASACGSTTVFASSFRPPEAEPLAMRGERVAAVVMVTDDAVRRRAEDALAREISHYGAIGVPMHTLLGGGGMASELSAREAIERSGVKGIVAMRPMGTKKKTTTETRTVWSDPMYASYWGGYYGYGWGNPWVYPGSTRGALVAGPPVVYGNPGHSEQVTETTEEEVVQVEVVVYSLKQNMLVFAGMSETTKPDKVDDFVKQLAAATVEELGKQRLIPSKY
jgi:hypothetical protein